MSKLAITSPVGRIVMGSLYEPNKTDADGKPLVTKHGVNAGQPRVNYFIALAIPKNPGETHWSQTLWGKQIWEVGNKAFPNIAQSPLFAWKIEDGDSQMPNKKGRKPCENEGFPGNWVLKLSGGYAPKIYQFENGGYLQVTTKDFIKAGYFVEVSFTVEGNGSQAQPGVYLNHNIICFRGYGQEIEFGMTPEQAGFGQAALPAGASSTPLNGQAPLPAGASSTPLNGQAPLPITPNHQFAQIVKEGLMTAAAGSLTYQDYISAGWNDTQLIANGLMLPY